MKLLNECDAESTGQCSLCRKSFLGIYPRLSGKWILSIEEETKLNQFTIFIFPISHAKPVVSFLETVPTRTNAHLSTSMLSSPIVFKNGRKVSPCSQIFQMASDSRQHSLLLFLPFLALSTSLLKAG